MSNEETTEKKQVKRPKSKTAYPWFDLDTVLQITKTIEQIGGGELSSATLARELGIAHASGAWNLRMRAGEQFNLFREENETVSLTDLGRRITSKDVPSNERVEASVQAFRSVELFRGVMDDLGEGKPIPQPAGLDDILKRKFGIVENRVRDARELLLKSARQAGVLESRGDRQYLVIPASKTEEGKTPSSVPPSASLTATKQVAETTTGTKPITININIQLQLPATENATIYDSLFSALKKYIFS